MPWFPEKNEALPLIQFRCEAKLSALPKETAVLAVQQLELALPDSTWWKQQALLAVRQLQAHLVLQEQQVLEQVKEWGLSPLRILPLAGAKHIFSHVEWHMTGYEVVVDELEKNCSEEMIFAAKDEIQKKYSIPSAFEAYLPREKERKHE